MLNEIETSTCTRSTNNPYRFGASLIFKRFLWDINPLSWISRQKLKNIKNSKFGQKAVILCNGPSLLNTDFNLLKNVYTIGLNKINLLFGNNEFRTNCIVAVNTYVIEQNKEFYNKTNIPLFVSHKGYKWIKARKNVYFLHCTSRRYFARDISLSVDEGATVTYVALQLAFHLGFTKVTLIGCDHDFVTKGPANKLVTMKGNDLNHFDPNYFDKDQKWQLPDLFESEVSYNMALEIFKLHDRQLFNSTSGGKLEIFPRIDLYDFINL